VAVLPPDLQNHSRPVLSAYRSPRLPLIGCVVFDPGLSCTWAAAPEKMPPRLPPPEALAGAYLAQLVNLGGQCGEFGAIPRIHSPLQSVTGPGLVGCPLRRSVGPARLY